MLKYPSTKALSSEEKDLLWKFRFYLSRDKRALTKFVKSVEWDDGFEARQAKELISKWVAIDVEDALELLSASFAERPMLRDYAVNQLRRADDEVLS